MVSAFGFDLFPRNWLMNAIFIEKEMRYGSRACDALARRAEGMPTMRGERVERGYMDGLADAFSGYERREEWVNTNEVEA
jgi:hypothetical protein